MPLKMLREIVVPCALASKHDSKASRRPLAAIPDMAGELNVITCVSQWPALHSSHQVCSARPACETRLINAQRRVFDPGRVWPSHANSTKTRELEHGVLPITNTTSRDAKHTGARHHVTRNERGQHAAVRCVAVRSAPEPISSQTEVCKTRMSCTDTQALCAFPLPRCPRSTHTLQAMVPPTIYITVRSAI